MSTGRAGDWLLSNNRYEQESKKTRDYSRKLFRAKTIAVTSGKGGVGKTSISVKLAKMYGQLGLRVLLIDCDYNLSNTAVKLGLPLRDSFIDYVNGKIKIEDCLYHHRDFHLLATCNGNFDIFDNKIEFDKIIIDLIVKFENEYDIILLDCPAGLSKESLTLTAYCDMRFVVVVPDKSSITDSYSLIKILNGRYGINENHLIVNRIQDNDQYKRLIKSLTDTVDRFLTCRLSILGKIRNENVQAEKFDRVLLEEENDLHNDFHKIFKNLVDDTVPRTARYQLSASPAQQGMLEQI